MMDRAARAGGRVFISYRRQETAPYAGRLYDRLADRLGEERVFIDVASIEPGLDFAEVIAGEVGACDVLLALIGRQWSTIADEDGHPRLDDPDDIVRLEIEAALERDIRVIPVLIEGAAMPRRQDLPDSLARLARRHALRISHESFRQDVSRLLQTLEGVLNAAASGDQVVPPSQTQREPEAKVHPAQQSAMRPDEEDAEKAPPYTPELTPLDIQHKEFAKVMRGYAMPEVDTFLDQITDEFTRLLDEITRRRENPELRGAPFNARLGPLDIQHKEFSKLIRGYAMPEVDTFLDQITEEFNRLLDEIART